MPGLCTCSAHVSACKVTVAVVLGVTLSRACPRYFKYCQECVAWRHEAAARYGILTYGEPALLQVHHMAEDAYSAWGQLHWAVKTGENAYIKTHNGKSLWEVLKVRALCRVPAWLQTCYLAQPAIPLSPHHTVRMWSLDLLLHHSTRGNQPCIMSTVFLLWRPEA